MYVCTVTNRNLSENILNKVVIFGFSWTNLRLKTCMKKYRKFINQKYKYFYVFCISIQWSAKIANSENTVQN